MSQIIEMGRTSNEGGLVPDLLLASSSLSPTALQGVRGSVVAAKSGLPLAGVEINWITSDQSQHHRGSTDVVIGAAKSEADGHFSIVPSVSPEAETIFCQLKHETGQSTQLEIPSLAKNGSAKRFAVNTTSLETIIRIDGPVPKKAQWAAFADYQMTNRRLIVSDLAQELVAPAVDSPVRSWTPAVRAGALDALDAANGDGPKTLKFAERETPVKFEALAKGDLAEALKFYQDGVPIDLNIDPGIFSPWLPLPKGDTELYRDYLRGAWVQAAQQMALNAPGTPATVSEDVLVRQLFTRFHQDFRTSDSVKVPAAKLLAKILKVALTTAANRDGFGKPAAAIPAQGTTSDEDYLNVLIALSGAKLRELQNRYRIAFVRARGAIASPIDLNVEALLGLLSDTWQSPPEPFPAEPAGRPKMPMIYPNYIGRAPFFLEYEEWLERQKRFYPENAYDIRRNLTVFSQRFRYWMDFFKAAAGPEASDYFPTVGDRQKSADWMKKLAETGDVMRAALASADLRNYPAALAKLDDADRGLDQAFKDAQNPWYLDRFDWLDNKNQWNIVMVSLHHRATRSVKTPEDLAKIEAWFDAPFIPESTNLPNADIWDMQRKGLAQARTASIWWLYYAHYVLIPYLRAQILFAMGNYAGAIKQIHRLTGTEVAVGETNTAIGYKRADFPAFHDDSSLPSTAAVQFDADGFYDEIKPGLDPADTRGPLVFWAKFELPPFEQKFLKLAQGEMMLEWADQLYRNDDPASIRRARELFKAVLFMHGHDFDVDIAPHFKGHGPTLVPGLNPFPLISGQENPALASQIRRAILGLWQIEQGLNAYGFSDDMVPVLRYQPLRQAAQYFATSAKSAQSDFIAYMVRFEEAQIEGWQVAAMVKKATASVNIAAEQIEIAKAGVAKAQAQVAEVQAQIAAKQNEITDKDSFFSQAKDFYAGMKDTFTGMMSAGKTATADGSENTMDGAGGAGIVAAYVAFAYYGYTTMSSMADASNKRVGELKALSEGALPAAQAQVKLKQRDVTIAGLQRDIAEADSELAATLMRFQKDRFLNVDLWNKLALFAQRLLKRYIDLGARFGWFAERALAYEQARRIDIINLNYFPTFLRGLTGADRLLADMAELEATRLDGLRLTAPIKHTISLAREFPVQFGRLKQKGEAVFHTSEATLRAAYPGTFGYRIRAVTAAAQTPQGPPTRGMLKNFGISAITDQTGAAQLLARYPDALPLSEFRLETDLQVYGLPGETLMQFEGSGYETDWGVVLPALANPKGLTNLADVLVTFDMNASYVQPAPAVAGVPAVLAQAVAIAASVFDPAGLLTLRGTTAQARIVFDMHKVPLRQQEANRRITNLAVMLIGTTTQTYTAKLSAGSAGPHANFTIDKGIAFSNGGVLLGTGAALPLNALIGQAVDQAFTLEIQRGSVGDEMKGLLDAVLYLDYEADV
jgi:Tc toxin complex TcA C-terminal TcB-binding domain